MCNKCGCNNCCRDNNCSCGCSCGYEDGVDACKCGFDNDNNQSVFPENYMYGQSYVPIQYMNKTFTPEGGLRMGTIFPELVSPYEPCQSIREIEYIKATNTIGEGCNG